MREGKPSFTAAAVAFARGVAGVDDVAKGLVPAGFALALRASAPSAARRAINVAAFGLVDHIELRTRAIDRALSDGVAAGAEQLVILGAGLDARAHRMPELADVEVFEVDHPSTQAYKRARMGGRAGDVRYVAVDFARDSLGERLAAAGHDASRPTFWIWEGVTMYLPHEATRATLAEIAARSAQGSRAAITYATPDGTPLGPRFVRVALVGFRVLGEPVVGMMARPQMAAELERAGFDVLADTEPSDWAREGPLRQRRTLLIRERLAVAQRR